MILNRQYLLQRNDKRFLRIFACLASKAEWQLRVERIWRLQEDRQAEMWLWNIDVEIDLCTLDTRKNLDVCVDQLLRR